MKLQNIPKANSLAMSSFILSGGMVIRAVILALLFFLITSNLGVEQYGQFTAILAFTSFFYPFVGLGSGISIAKEISCSTESKRKIWGKSVVSILVTSVPLIAIVVLTGSFWVAPTASIKLLVSIALAELLLNPIVQSASALYQVQAKALVTSFFLAGLVLFRLASFVCFLYFSTNKNLEIWGVYYLGSSLIFTAIVILYINLDIGIAKLEKPKYKALFSTGLSYSLIQFSGKISTDIDKVMLSRMDTLTNTGLYAAAYRIMELLYLPVSSLVWTLIGRFFKAGEQGTSKTIYLVKKILPLPLLYLIICITLVFLYSDKIPLVLGSEFKGIEEIITVLSFLMIIFFYRQLLKQALVALHFAKFSAITELFGAIINLLLNFLLIPEFSWRGAVFATFISELVISIAYSLYVVIILRRELISETNKYEHD